MGQCLAAVLQAAGGICSTGLPMPALGGRRGLAIGLALVVAGATAGVAAGGQYEHVSFRQRWAVLVGVGAYGPNSGLPSLERVRLDVELMRRALVEGGSFAPENIATLVDAAATRASLQSLFAQLADQVGEGDLVFFYFSGRGTRTADDLYPDMEPDGLDECLLLADAVWGQASTYWRDDELGRLLRKARSRYTVVVIDAGYSGEGPLSKGLESPLERKAKVGSLDGITRTDYLPNNAAVLTAGGPAETIREGVFTDPLAAQLQRADKVVKLGEVYDDLNKMGRDSKTSQPRLQPENRLFRSLPLAGPSLLVEADSLDAEVLIDDRLVDVTTPVDVVLEPGRHTLRVRKGAAVWATELTVDGVGRLEPIQARLEVPLAQSASQPWGQVVAGGGAALLFVVYLGYRILRQRQVQIEEERRRSYPLWARQIEEGLLGVRHEEPMDQERGFLSPREEQGRSVGEFRLGGIPRIHRSLRRAALRRRTRGIRPGGQRRTHRLQPGPAPGPGTIRRPLAAGARLVGRQQSGRRPGLCRGRPAGRRPVVQNPGLRLGRGSGTAGRPFLGHSRPHYGAAGRQDPLALPPHFPPAPGLRIRGSGPFADFDGSLWADQPLRLGGGLPARAGSALHHQDAGPGAGL